MTRTRMMVAGIVAATSLAACGRGKSATTDLSGELEAATGDTSGLLPNRGGTQFVSAIERTPGAVPAVASPVKQPKPAPKAQPQPVQSPVVNKAPAPAAEAVVMAPVPAPTPTPAATPAPTPTPTPTPTPHRRGGYSNMGTIIRNAPFPINP
jgi:outer membrane biosynthesis protein TonB